MNAVIPFGDCISSVVPTDSVGCLHCSHIYIYIWLWTLAVMVDRVRYCQVECDGVALRTTQRLSPYSFPDVIIVIFSDAVRRRHSWSHS